MPESSPGRSGLVFLESDVAMPGQLRETTRRMSPTGINEFLRSNLTELEKIGGFGRHSLRVANLVLQLSRSQNVPRVEQPSFFLGALLHDNGKTIQPEVFSRPSNLRPEDVAAIQRHVTDGFDIAKTLPAPVNDVVLTTILHSHEAFNGTGYPSRLSGSKIPLAAQLTHLADTFDTLTSDRPYQQASTPQSALEIIQKNAGVQFNPKLTEIFISLYQDGAFFTVKEFWPEICKLLASIGIKPMILRPFRQKATFVPTA